MSDWLDRFLKVLAPLSWGFDEGDDGTLITLTLEQADSLLRELPGLRRANAENLQELLQEFGVPKDEVEMVESLFGVGREASYGDGLSDEDAEAVNDVAQDVAVLLEEFAETQRKSTGRGKPPPSVRIPKTRAVIYNAVRPHTKKAIPPKAAASTKAAPPKKLGVKAHVRKKNTRRR